MHRDPSTVIFNVDIKRLNVPRFQETHIASGAVGHSTVLLESPSWDKASG